MGRRGSLLMKSQLSSSPPFQGSQRVSDCIRVYQGQSAIFKVLQGSSGRNRVRQGSSGFVRVHHGPSLCIRVHQGCISVHQRSSGIFEMFQSFLKGSHDSSGCIRGASGVHQGCIRVLEARVLGRSEEHFC